MRRLVAILALVLLLPGAPCPAEPGDEPVWQPAAPTSEPLDLVIDTLDGTSHHLAEFRGKVVLLSFWATWCAPCIAELPSLMKAADDIGGDRIALIAVSEDRGGAADVEKFLRRYPRLEPLPRYLDPGRRAAKGLAIGIVPTTLVLDRDGRELGRLIGAGDWTSPELRQRLPLGPPP